MVIKVNTNNYWGKVEWCCSNSHCGPVSDNYVLDVNWSGDGKSKQYAGDVEFNVNT
ncbi:hypothetical protein [Methanobrevibacter sp.]